MKPILMRREFLESEPAQVRRDTEARRGLCPLCRSPYRRCRLQCGERRRLRRRRARASISSRHSATDLKRIADFDAACPALRPPLSAEDERAALKAHERATLDSTAIALCSIPRVRRPASGPALRFSPPCRAHGPTSRPTTRRQARMPGALRLSRGRELGDRRKGPISHWLPASGDDARCLNPAACRRSLHAPAAISRRVG